MPTRKFTFNKVTYRLDVRPDRFDLRDRYYQPKLINLPAQFPSTHAINNLFTAYQQFVLNQGEEGACTGFGLAAVINYLLFRDEVVHLLRDEKLSGQALQKAIHKHYPDPSDQLVSPAMLYYLARVYDEWEGEDYEGSSCRGALKGWHKHGVCLRNLWPFPTDDDFDASRTAGTRGYLAPPSEEWQEDAPQRPLGAYYRIDIAALNDLQSAIHEVGAVYVSADVHAGWDLEGCDSLKDAVIVMPKSRKTEGSHAFALIGYTPQGFIVQNSWGTSWGVKGFALLPYEDWLAHASDAWAVSLGAIVSGSAVADKKRPTRSSSMKLGDGRGLSTSIFDFFRHDKPVPGPDNQVWDPKTDEGLLRCHQHAVVMDRGQPAERLIIPRGHSTAEYLGQVLPTAWFAKKKPKTPRLLIFAHGGLNEEKAAIERVAKMAPWFLLNDIYPLFLVWKTGPLETIGNLLSDELQHLKDSFGPSGGVLDHLRSRFLKWIDAASEKKDYFIEQAADRVLVRAAWSDMKASAENAAREGGATHQLAAAIAKLKAALPALEIHLLGHSAGSLILGEMLRRLKGHGLGVSSCHLFAAACTIPFANRTYGKALSDGVLKKDTLYQSVLSNKLERDDTCFGIYGKSLLYLVSRGLETPHKMPLLGLAAAIDTASAAALKREDQVPWPTDQETEDEISRWRALKLPNVDVLDEPKVIISTDKSKKPISRSHGSFDNDIVLINKTICRILGRPKVATPAVPVMDLDY